MAEMSGGGDARNDQWNSIGNRTGERGLQKKHTSRGIEGEGGGVSRGEWGSGGVVRLEYQEAVEFFRPSARDVALTQINAVTGCQKAWRS